jgi:hypothetical protein
MRAVGEERLEPPARLRRCIRFGDADRRKSERARLVGELALDLGRVAQKSRSP